MAHEKSITIETDNNRWVNIKTVYRGRNVSNSEAVDLFRAGKINSLGGRSFSNEPDASKAAAARSKRFKSQGQR
jgi:hypothetical protein